MSAPRFDVLAYAADAHGSHRSALTGLGEPLPDPVRALLGALHGHLADTTEWLSRVLVTPTHKDARITAFLSAWAYERHWLADAVGVLLADPAPRPHAPSAAERLAPLREALLANVHGPAVTAAQLAERVVDGALVLRMLAAAAAAAPAPVAADLTRLRGVLLRQQEFFTEAALERLTGSARARRLARSRLAARAWPLGAQRDPAGTARALAALTALDPAWVAELDAEADRLPGLAGLRLMAASATHPGRPALRTPLRPAAALGRLAASGRLRRG